MDQQKIKRINELYKKSKAEGLTDARCCSGVSEVDL